MERSRQDLTTNPRYEVMPFKSLDQQLDHLPKEATVTVTCSKEKGLDATLNAMENLRDHGFETVPHLAARMIESEGHLDEAMGRMAAAGVTEAFIVGGDQKEPAGPYGNSLQLMEAIKNRDESIKLGGTAYPDGHPEISEKKLMLDLLERQQYMGYVATQMCFDSKKIVQWSDKMKEEDFNLPIKAGLIGAVDLKKLIKISSQVGVGGSFSFAKKNPMMISRLVMGGGNDPTKQFRELEPSVNNPENNLDGYHIYTFNAVENTENWRQQMLDDKTQKRKR